MSDCLAKNSLDAPFNIGLYFRGYPVRLYDYAWNVAVFVQEDEAIEYASYRNAMLKKYDTTDVQEYKEDWHG